MLFEIKTEDLIKLETAQKKAPSLVFSRKGSGKSFYEVIERLSRVKNPIIYALYFIKPFSRLLFPDYYKMGKYLYRLHSKE